MPKFCGKCGSRLDETTGLCPNCDESKIKEDLQCGKMMKTSDLNRKVGQVSEEIVNIKDDKKKRKANRRTEKKEKRQQWSTAKKVRRFFLKLIIWIILLGGMGGFILFGLVYSGVISSSFIEPYINQQLPSTYVNDVKRDIPETNISDFTLHQSSEANIVTDMEEGVTYVNNELLVTLNSSDDKVKLEEYIAQYGGSIVGEIVELYDYQILFNYEYSIEELNSILHGLEDQPWVNSVSPNYCIKLDTQYIPNDSKWVNKWGEVPEGTNWGVEAIDAQGAWEYIDSISSTVNVGIIDNMFDVHHEDLVFAEAPLGNNMALKDSKWDDHGTHTSGTIAATMNNKKGISGVCANCNLYGVSYVGLAVNGYETLQSFKVALYYLIATNHCSVINMSIGVDHLTFEASRGCNVATTELLKYASGIENVLQILIDKGYQFVICKSAGNQNEVNGSYQYFRKNQNDVDYPYEYYSYSDYLEYLNGESGYECFAEYKKDRNAIENRLESGNVDAKYDLLGIIENQAVKDRIIVVGAVRNKGTHKEGGFLWFGGKTVHDGFVIADFSQCGKRVDVLAPGVDIYSTVKNSYSSKAGTSMAAPHVSGVAAFMFSVNPNLSAKNVKDIICDTAVNAYGEEGYGLLNAKNAVEASIDYSPSARGNSDERDIVLVLDVSGSMEGTPIQETQKASANFIDTILGEEARIGIVAYDDSTYKLSDFSVNKRNLTDAVAGIYGGGGTNIEAGLSEAHAMLNESSAKKKIIVLMSDGEPNNGKEGDDLIAYADKIKSNDIVIYTLGFFDSLGSNKSSAQRLMEELASDGCHYEVANADDLVFFFEDMADQINGQKYIYIRIACPIEVSVTHNGEVLCSAEDNLSLRTDFGTLTFEENEKDSDIESYSENRIKILRLKEGADYDVEIVGTGHGIMDYTIGFMDENGDYSDLRKFEDIKITRRTKIDTVAKVSKESVLNIDENGDGKYDLKLRAEKNGYGEEVKKTNIVYVVAGGLIFLMLLILLCIGRKKYKQKK